MDNDNDGTYTIRIQQLEAENRELTERVKGRDAERCQAIAEEGVGALCLTRDDIKSATRFIRLWHEDVVDELAERVGALGTALRDYLIQHQEAANNPTQPCECFFCEQARAALAVKKE